ncbi:MAG: DoxX family membrane protein [Prosthecobacter sp.]|jgi:uncharacterized membrane protein YphA (DoxX/SURF4 family)|nr:DoxX family membrane protein [Prosthecobacter sp.]
MNRIQTLFSLIFGGVFVYAGAVKVLQPMVFVDDIRSFHLLPDPLPALVALFLPWLEILAGLAVCSGWLRRGGLMLLLSCLLVFLVAIGISWQRGIDIRCGCFGGSSASASNYLELVIRDLLLLALGAWLSRHVFRGEHQPVQ